MKAVKIIVKGIVQGVFFRYNTFKKAKELGLNGYVENLKDGSVKILVEGSEEKINRLINFCKMNPGRSKVEDVEVTEIATINAENFKIKY